ncbi:MAG: phosphatase domain-containing protein [Nitrososphaerales archaeon]
MFEKGDILRFFYGWILGRPMNFSFIDEFVSGSAGPLRKKEVDWMREKKGIGAILSVKEVPLASGWVENLRYLNVPVKNHFPPTIDQLKQCVDFILRETSSGKKTSVHCAAGKGRTGTVLAAYLCAKYGKSADDAILEIRAKRKGSIEKKQEAVIQEYCKGSRDSK